MAESMMSQNFHGILVSIFGGLWVGGTLTNHGSVVGGTGRKRFAKIASEVFSKWMRSSETFCLGFMGSMVSKALCSTASMLVVVVVCVIVKSNMPGDASHFACGPRGDFFFAFRATVRLSTSFHPSIPRGVLNLIPATCAAYGWSLNGVTRLRDTRPFCT